MPRKIKCKSGYDFAGWATVANTLCSDGRTIMKDAFKDNDGQTVPLVWNHDHESPMNVLGHALLENADEGVIAHCKFNDTESGQAARTLVRHKDVCSLSIYANKLKQDGGNVLHGNIREVSLVLAGANPGAYIEDVMMHSDGSMDEARIWNESDEVFLYHADEPESKGEIKMAEEKKAEEKKSDGEKTIGEIFDTFTEEQKTVVYALIGQALEDAGGSGSEDEGDEKEMKHNVFEQDRTGSYSNVLTHSDFETIKVNAKRAGSWKDAYNEFVQDYLQHDDEPSAETTYTDREGNAINYNLDASGNPYGVGNYEYMFPDARFVGQVPAVIKRDMGWVSKVVNGAKHSPFSRIKTIAADLTEDAARAKGYIKGKYKKEEFFSLLKRVTTPTTIYKKQKMDRDDVIDITEWDVIAWLRQEMRMMLDEELARAALIGDGRLADDDDHINPQNIRPIATDADLYTIKINIADSGVETTGSDARDFINAVVYNRRKYKGSGEPSMFIQEDMLTECLMLTDEIGRDLYENVAKLATKLRVKELIPCPILENPITLGVTTVSPLAIMVNMTDYTFGADKGGAVNMFDDFDIDYNQQKYLIETRCSGALTVPYSAMLFAKDASAEPDPFGHGVDYNPGNAVGGGG